MSLMSAPAMKLDFAEAITAPFTEASLVNWSMQSARSWPKSGVSTFIGRPATSISSVAIPSPSTA